MALKNKSRLSDEIPSSEDPTSISEMYWKKLNYIKQPYIDFLKLGDCTKLIFLTEKKNSKKKDWISSLL